MKVHVDLKFARHPAALCLLAVAAFAARAQESTTPAQQAPAPIVRATPPQTKPIILRPAVNPDGTINTPTPRRSPPAYGVTGASGSTGSTTTTPKKPAIPKSAATNATQTTAAKTPTAARATTVTAAATQVPTAPLNRTTIVLDPAHGGADGGSRIGDSIQEKQVTLALAFKLRSLLQARGFTVVMTRDNDAATQPNAAATPLTLDDRAGIANRPHAVACLLLHATGRGTGIHLYTSELEPTPGEPTLIPWLTAQAAWVGQSQKLEKDLATALGRARLALVSSTASIRPVDSLACPALVVELAPRGDDAGSINDSDYQQSVAQALAGALVFWQNTAQAPPRLLPTPSAVAIAAAKGSTATAAKPKPKPAPKPQTAVPTPASTGVQP